jgi:flagellar biosynthetic protein FliQ
MTPDELVPLGQHALVALALILAPVTIPALVVGLLLGLVQAATSINEATLTFVPKLFVVLLSLALFGGAMLGMGQELFLEVFERIPAMAR